MSERDDIASLGARDAAQVAVLRDCNQGREKTAGSYSQGKGWAMNHDIENATIAAQCALLLCTNLRALAITENLTLSDAVIAELQIAAAQRIRLERIAANLKQMEVKA